MQEINLLLRNATETTDGEKEKKFNQFIEKCLVPLVESLHLKTEQYREDRELVSVSPEGLAGFANFIYFLEKTLSRPEPLFEEQVLEPLILPSSKILSGLPPLSFDEAVKNFNELGIIWNDLETKRAISDLLRRILETLFGLDKIPSSYAELIGGNMLFKYNGTNFAEFVKQVKDGLLRRYVVVGNGGKEDLYAFLTRYFPIARDSKAMEARYAHEVEHIETCKAATEAVGLDSKEPQFVVTPYIQKLLDVDVLETFILLPVVSIHFFYDELVDGKVSGQQLREYLELAHQISDPSQGDKLNLSRIGARTQTGE